MEKYVNKNGVTFEDILENNVWICRISKGINSFDYGNNYEIFATRNDVESFDLKDFTRFTVLKEEDEINTLDELVEVIKEKVEEKVDEKIEENLLNDISKEFDEDEVDTTLKGKSHDELELMMLEDQLKESEERIILQQDSPELLKREKKTRTNLKRKITMLKNNMK